MMQASVFSTGKGNSITKICDGGSFTAVGHGFGINESTIRSNYKMHGADSFISFFFKPSPYDNVGAKLQPNTD